MCVCGGGGAIIGVCVWGGGVCVGGETTHHLTHPDPQADQSSHIPPAHKATTHNTHT